MPTHPALSYLASCCSAVRAGTVGDAGTGKNRHQVLGWYLEPGQRTPIIPTLTTAPGPKTCLYLAASACSQGPFQHCAYVSTARTDCPRSVPGTCPVLGSSCAFPISTP